MTLIYILIERACSDWEQALFLLLIFVLEVVLRHDAYAVGAALLASHILACAM